MAKPVRLPGASQLTPLLQGDLDKLCGLYSIINAIQIALYPVTRLADSALQELFGHGLQILATDDRKYCAMEAGMPERCWMRLCDGVVSFANCLTGRRLRSSLLFSASSQPSSRLAIGSIKRSVQGGSPVLVLLWGSYDHCTVVAGYTDTRMLLFDSLGYRSITYANTSVYYPSSRKRHQISRRSAMAISLMRKSERDE